MTWEGYLEAMAALRTVRGKEVDAGARAEATAAVEADAIRRDRRRLHDEDAALLATLRSVRDLIGSEIAADTAPPPPTDRAELRSRLESLQVGTEEAVSVHDSLTRSLRRLEAHVPRVVPLPLPPPPGPARGRRPFVVVVALLAVLVATLVIVVVVLITS